MTIAIGLLGSTAPAEARHRHHYGHRAFHVRHYVHVRRHASRHHSYAESGGVSRGGFLRPTYASIIVDANTGRTLEATNESTPHHPASVTKVMTLYLLFEQLENGRIALDSDITVSAHAASMAPSKLGLRPGSSIEVEDAIKAVVTKSANDIAVAIAEKIGGDEGTFADMMTRKAHALGMNGTTYRNASGLPNPAQITTARDLAILGRAIQDRFPRYYRYFSTRSFYFAGRSIRNHNHLLGAVEGVDGIKTGYTAASGFNLLTSVRRDGRHLVGVVLGGRSGPQRDRIMAGLIAENIGDASARRTALAAAERDDDEDSPPPAKAAAIVPPQEIAPRVEARPEARAEPRRETAALDLAVPPAPMKAEPIKVEPAKFDLRVEKPRPAYVAATQRQEPEADDASPARPPRRPVVDGSTSRSLAYASVTPTATPSSLRWVSGPAGHPKAAAAGKTVLAKTVPAKPESKSAEAKPVEKPAEKIAEKIALARPANSGWMIQIGATDDAEKANELLARAKTKASLGGARPFTEKVQKAGGTLWRARFAGLEETSAEAACRSLKRSGFACFTTRD
jgi:D-alanyl-D-alanine carboxypeptidase